MNKKQILKQHKFNIYKGQVKSNGKTYSKWITYVVKNEKRCQIKRNTKQEIEDYLIEFYSSEEFNKTTNTFKDYFYKWLDFKTQIVSDNTIYKYKKDYIRFFEDTDFENIDISCINEQHITIYLADTIKRLDIKPRTLKSLCGYIKEIFDCALCDKVIATNPYIYVKPRLPLITKQCNRTRPKTAEERTISPEDIRKLLSKFREDYINKPEYITPYAVEFALLTGCRVGEIAALRWSDIENSIITIKCSEKAHRNIGNTTTYTIEGTKTGKERKIPVTTDIQDLLLRVKKAEININCINEFVFADRKGRIKAPNISNCIRKKCLQAGIEQKSIHACRRTVNSTLKNLGADTSIAASLLGHTFEVNESCYTYDVSGLDTKKALLEQTNKVLTMR